MIRFNDIEYHFYLMKEKNIILILFIIHILESNKEPELSAVNHHSSTSVSFNRNTIYDKHEKGGTKASSIASS